MLRGREQVLMTSIFGGYMLGGLSSAHGVAKRRETIIHVLLYRHIYCIYYIYGIIITMLYLYLSIIRPMPFLNSIQTSVRGFSHGLVRLTIVQAQCIIYNISIGYFTAWSSLYTWSAIYSLFYQILIIHFVIRAPLRSYRSTPKLEVYLQPSKHNNNII